VPDTAKKDYASTDPDGWTMRLEYGRYNAIANGYLVPARGDTTNEDFSGFFTTGAPVSSTTTSTKPEEYLYAIEVTPTPPGTTNQASPRMAPIVDDVQVVYMLDSGTVIEEVELVD